MLTSSKKGKARNLQKWVRDVILKHFPSLTNDDARSTSMGSSGVDILLSAKGKEEFPFAVECKFHKSFAVYSMYEQAVSNSDKSQPLLIIKANNKKPLAIVDAEWFIRRMSD